MKAANSKEDSNSQREYRHAIHECAHWTIGQLIGWRAKAMTILPLRPGTYGHVLRVTRTYDVLWGVEQSGGDVASVAAKMKPEGVLAGWKRDRTEYAKRRLLVSVAGVAAVNAILGETLVLTDGDLKDAQACASVLNPEHPAWEIENACNVIRVACSGPIGSAIVAAAKELQWRRHLELDALAELWERIKPPAECFLAQP